MSQRELLSFYFYLLYFSLLLHFLYLQSFRGQRQGCKSGIETYWEYFFMKLTRRCSIWLCLYAGCVLISTYGGGHCYVLYLR